MSRSCLGRIRWARSLFALLLVTALARAADGPSPSGALPPGYRLLYEQNFADETALADFVFSDPQAWRFSREDGRGALELAAQSRYTPRVRSPVNLALIADRVFGEFVLEVDLVQTGREYGHRDMCLFFGAKDPANFYYVHLATAADDHAHNIFLVNDAPRVKIATPATQGVNWGVGVWHRVRLERKLSDGSIRVFFDDLTTPIMTATDWHFDYGLIGFGSFDDTGKVAQIRVWGPGWGPRRAGFFH
ncbi:MAG: hypothetical protein FJ387_15610 [Verrucomicrobia bacterium]|nr:hypothetical protein [Verrucomicrobiota bacterium]